AYYLSPTGDDAADGLSPVTAWRTLARASATVLAPGDRLLLEGGAHFDGTLELGPEDAGSPAGPVVVGTFGTGRPIIEAGNGSAIVVTGTGGVEISDLVVVGNPTAYDRWTGILLTNKQPDAKRLGHVHLTRVEVSGFKRGIEVSASGSAGFRDVLVAEA